ncbi:MAG: acetyl-CoA carboxylase carboxyltransferase subunit alpha [Planctomycetota bacterium]
MSRARAKEDRLKNALSFERPVRELDLAIEDLLAKLSPAGQSPPADHPELVRLQAQRDELLGALQANLTVWQRIQLSRHVDRPVSSDYLELMLSDSLELHGDRLYGDDKAIFAGFATLEGRRLMLVAHRKGRSTQERIECNWGCAHPEGYRKALRCMQLAERLGLPILTLINTPGAYPGIGAEERGQASAIAWNIFEMFRLKVPVVSVVIGEGGSGGALGIGVCDRLLILENAYYSVISPEGCASILWKDGARAEEAAHSLKLGSDSLLSLGVADEVIAEPPGGAHRDKVAMAARLKEALMRHFHELSSLPPQELLARRHAKYRAVGKVVRGGPPVAAPAPLR